MGLFGPDALVMLGEIFDDGERIPDGEVAIGEHRDLAGR
jgi:hypothetical protein